MATASDVILRFEEEGFADGRRLLAHGQVCGTLVNAGDVPVAALLLDLRQHLLAFANEEHVAVDPEGILRRERPGGQLLGQGPPIGVDGDGAEDDGLRPPHLLGGDDELLPHGRVGARDGHPPVVHLSALSVSPRSMFRMRLRKIHRRFNANVADVQFDGFHATGPVERNVGRTTDK